MMQPPHRVAFRYLLIFLCLLPVPVIAQIIDRGTVFLAKDSLPYNIGDPVWRFAPRDVAGGADTTLDDSTWPLVSSRLYVRLDTVEAGFKGIGWMRLRLIIDSSLSGRTLALRIKQTGASEIYLDGRRLRSYGQLLPADSAEYLNPQEMPMTLPTLSAGTHLLAIRYANWEYIRNKHRYAKSDAGLRIAIWDANSAIESHTGQFAAVLFACVLLFGIFITLSLVHLILYLYYRADKANGRFSLFAAGVALLILVPCLIRLSEDALFILKISYMELGIVAVVALSLSFLLNGLFSKRKWHFYIAAAACLSIIPALLFWQDAIPISLLAIIIVVPLEALYILVSALWRKLPGARIIGGGLLLLISLLLVVLGLIFVQGDVYLNDNTLAGQIFLIVLVLAILSIPISMSMYLAWRFATVNRSLKTQLEQVETLSAHAREQEAEKQRLLETRQEELEREVALRTEELRGQKKKSDDLLLNILPTEIAEELKESGSSTARLYDNVTVLFTDFVDFTQHSITLTPTALVAELDECFRAFDDTIGRHGLEKIKTVGDAYIAVSGMPAANKQHAQDVVRAGLEIKAFMEERRKRLPKSFGIRLGVHSGPVVAGIVGVKKFAYDIWGDTVNTAARMEQHSEPGRLNISADTYELVKDDFRCTLRGELEVKHKGRMNMYFVE